MSASFWTELNNDDLFCRNLNVRQALTALSQQMQDLNVTNSLTLKNRLQDQIISSFQPDGVTGYGQGDVVLYQGGLYASLTAGNTATVAPNSANWQQISAISNPAYATVNSQLLTANDTKAALNNLVPFQTIQAALNFVGPNGFVEITSVGATYTETVNMLSGQTLYSESVVGSQRNVIAGELNMLFVGGCRVSGLSFSNSSATCFAIGALTSTCYIENVLFIGAIVVITINNSWASSANVYINECSATSSSVLWSFQNTGTNQTNTPTLYFRNYVGPLLINQNSTLFTGLNIVINQANQLQIFAHSSGNITVVGSYFFNDLVSNCLSGAGSLNLYNTSLRDIVTHAYHIINQSGSCNLTMIGVDRDISADTLGSGTISDTVAGQPLIYKNGNSYDIDQVVISGGSLYKCLFNNVVNSVPSQNSSNWSKITEVDSELFTIDGLNGNDTKAIATPSVYAFQTLTTALGIGGVTHNYHIISRGQTYTMVTPTWQNMSNTAIYADDVVGIESNPTGNTILGTLTPVGQCKIQNLTLIGPTTQEGLRLTFSAVMGNSLFENCTFASTSGTFAVNSLPTSATWPANSRINFLDCTFASQNINIDNTGGGTLATTNKILFERCSTFASFSLLGNLTNCVIEFDDCPNLAISSHNSGTLIIRNCNITQLTSACTTANGSIELYNCSFWTDSMTQGVLNKTGTGAISLTNTVMPSDTNNVITYPVGTNTPQEIAPIGLLYGALLTNSVGTTLTLNAITQYSISTTTTPTANAMNLISALSTTNFTLKYDGLYKLVITLLNTSTTTQNQSGAIQIYVSTSSTPLGTPPETPNSIFFRPWSNNISGAVQQMVELSGRLSAGVSYGLWANNYTNTSFASQVLFIRFIYLTK